jgi:hypothetical protein
MRPFEARRRQAAMIEIHVNPVQVERVLFVAGSHLEEDFDHAAWTVIRQLVDRMDRRLRKAAAGVVTASPAAARPGERRVIR